MMTSIPPITDVKVKLSGTDGNAFAILGVVVGAMRSASVSDSIVKAFLDEARSGDYDHLLATCFRYVHVA